MSQPLKSEPEQQPAAPVGQAECDPPPAEAQVPPVVEVSLAQSAASAAAALFGVQSSKNRERDFNSNNPGKFILMGTLMTCLFALCVLIAVRCSMQQAGVVP